MPFFGGLRPNIGGGGGFVNPNRGFSETYRCFPTAMMQQGSSRENVNYGGKSKCMMAFDSMDVLLRLYI